MSTITETCSCGASITCQATYTSDVRKVAEEWRESHKHAESVGICGDQPQPLHGRPEHIARPCVLKAGHTGAHGDGEGAHWQEVPQNGPEAATGRPRSAERGSGTPEPLNGPQIGKGDA